jgi:hypothetical protein
METAQNICEFHFDASEPQITIELEALHTVASGFHEVLPNLFASAFSTQEGLPSADG